MPCIAAAKMIRFIQALLSKLENRKSICQADVKLSEKQRIQTMK